MPPSPDSEVTSRQPVGEFLAALGAGTPAPASGAAAALTAAMGSALTQLAANVAGAEEEASRAGELVARLEVLADEDSAAYGAFMAERSEATRRRIIEVPEEIATCAEEAATLAEGLVPGLKAHLAADAESGVALARAGAAVARRLAKLNEG